MDKLNPWEYDDNYLKSCTGQASMDSITYSSHMNTLFFFFPPPQRQLGDRKGADIETLKDTPKHTGVTLSSEKRTLNQTQPLKFTSVCGGL